MTLLQLSYFCMLARLLNFHEAAEELHISQPTLSIAIANLEKELDLHLFERKGKHVSLTKCGNAYYERVGKVLEELESANREVRRVAHEIRGKVSVAYNQSWPSNLVPQQVQAFMKDYRNAGLRFGFTFENTPRIIAGVRSGVYDVGFCCVMTPEDIDGDLNTVPILTQEVVVIAPQNHELACKASVSLRELAKYPFVTYYAESGMRPVVESYLRKAAVKPGLVTVAPDEGTIATLVASGAGCALIAKVDSLADYNVEILPVSDFECHRTLCMVYQNSEYLTQPVLRFINFVKKHWAKQA
jgi:DNA-binding transcriptional LysR family regulator